MNEIDCTSNILDYGIGTTHISFLRKASLYYKKHIWQDMHSRMGTIMTQQSGSL